MPSLGLSGLKGSWLVLERWVVLEGSFEKELRLYYFFREDLLVVERPDSYLSS